MDRGTVWRSASEVMVGYMNRHGMFGYGVDVRTGQARLLTRYGSGHEMSELVLPRTESGNQASSIRRPGLSRPLAQELGDGGGAHHVRVQRLRPAARDAPSQGGVGQGGSEPPHVHGTAVGPPDQRLAGGPGG